MGNIYEKLKETCKDNAAAEAKCAGLENKINGKCTTFKAKIGTAVKKPILEDKDCTELGRQCLFLEGADPDKLKEDCNTLRNKCYQNKREEVAVEVLLRALGDGSLEKSANAQGNKKCEEKLKEVCKELSSKSNELAILCLDATKTCTKLVTSAETKCKALKNAIDTLNSDIKKETCLPLLEQCHFYKENCKDSNEPNCKKLVEDCGKQKITFAPPGTPFIPIKPPATLAQKIGLTALYQKAAQDGVYIGSASTRDIYNLLALLSQSSTSGNNIKEKCENALKTKCKDLKEHPILKGMCESDDKASKEGNDACEALQNKLTNLPQKIKGRLGGQDPSTKAVPWHQLPDQLKEDECTAMLSQCSYYGPHDTPNLGTLCKNVRVACYKRGLGAMAYEALEERLRGEFNKTDDKHEELLKPLVEKCKELRESGALGNDELLSRCLQPLSTISLVLYDLHYKLFDLHNHLNERRDFPGEEDCETLESKCEAFGQDFDSVHHPCITLRSHCDRLRQAEELEALLLVRTKESLKNTESCEKKVQDICRRDARLGRNGRSFACANTTFTCQTITENVKRKCDFLGENINIHNATEEITNSSDKEGLCDFWESYCDAYMSHSDTLSNEAGGNGGECKKLKEACKKYRDQRKLEDRFMAKLAGTLGDEKKCNEAYLSYCSAWNNTGHDLSGLCKNSSNSGNGNPTLCQKSMRRVKQKCVGLSKKLEDEKKALETEKNKYDKLKQDAEDLIGRSSLVLAKASTVGTQDNVSKVVNTNSSSTPSANKTQDANSTSNNNSTAGNSNTQRLAKRSEKQVQITTQEVTAFDKAGDVLIFYDELNEKCKKLKIDCLFREECDGCKDICEKIDQICHKLQPLEVKEQTIKVITTTKNITTTTTTTTTTTHTTEAATCSLTCSAPTICTTVRTTDTWVTHTSTHTSTSTQTSTITSTVTFTSTRRCKPTKCTTEGGDEEGHVKPSAGVRISGGSVMKSLVLTILVWMLM